MLAYFGANFVHFLLRRVETAFFSQMWSIHEEWKQETWWLGECKHCLLSDPALQVYAAPRWIREEGGEGGLHCLVEESEHPID